MELDNDEESTKKWRCRMCGHIGLDESDGFFYCQECGAQADDIILTGVADEDFVDKDGEGALYSARHTRRSQPTARTPHADPSSMAWFRYTQEEDDNNNDTNKIKKEEQEQDYSNYYYDDVVGPTEPEDFGSGDGGKLKYEDYYNEVRIRYVMGMQWMIQLQCEALVEKFNVSPLICGVASTVWLRFLAGTGVFKDAWADDSLLESERQTPGEPEDIKHLPRYANEPHNAYGQRAVMIWFRSLRRTIPLSCSLAIPFLACHVVREAVLPTDIVKWCLEGKLPYFTAHIEIEKRFERSSPACPISSSLMFRPSQAVPLQKLETMAATIAESIGLHLPPVNFYAIASRYLKQLSLPVEKILPHACRIYEWSMPPELWLSTNEFRLPTRIYVLSILIVAIRILYNINGFGAWERSLSSSHQTGGLDSPSSSETKVDAVKSPGSSPPKLDDSAEKSVRNDSHVQKSDLDSAELLHNLEAKYNEIGDTLDYTKDLPSYLQYCKDVVFAGAGPSHINYREEDEFIEKLWDFYQNARNSEPAEDHGAQTRSVFNEKRSRNDDECVRNQTGEKKIREGCHKIPSDDTCTYQGNLDNDHVSHNSLGDRDSEHNNEVSEDTLKNKAIRQMKLDMEENMFCYIPPRVNLKRFDYLHYARRKADGALTYVAHADYYILLRACARAAQVDARIMHMGVLNFERRLAWVEKRIDRCLHLTPPNIICQFCADGPSEIMDDPVGLSKLSL